MVMSALSAPLYAKALIDSMLRRKSKFVVTPKGDSASPDRWFGTFRYHWYFITIFGGSIAAGFVFGHSHPAMITWACFALLITATPIYVWRYELRQDRKKQLRRKRRRHAAASAPQPQDAGPAPAPAHGVPHEQPWAASGGGADQTMQIALGGRKE
jgi:hypothetical protein